MKKKTLLYIPFFLFVFLFILTFRPIMNPSMDNCKRVEGIVSVIKINDQSQDIFLRIDGDPVRYYINRGLTQRGLSDILFASKGKKIAIYPVNHWTPLDMNNSTKHIARVEIGNKVIYDETVS